MQRLNKSVNNVAEGLIVLNEIKKEFQEVSRQKKTQNFLLSKFLFL
jgi:hypothetical protein